ncbi:MAG: DDE-type integrase/transposase/recombinase, partial [Acetobacteraceae bacterium]
SLIKQLFRSIVKKVKLGDYWRSLWKRYGYGARKLSDEKVVWVVKARESGLATRDVASTQNVSVRRVEQLYAQYKKSKEIPSLKKAGRPRVEIPVGERNAILEASKKFGVGACYLVSILKRDYSVETNHMRVYRVLKEEGMLYSTARTRFKRKWIRYEREHSNSLWHVDWHEMKASFYKSRWLVIYEDDASRYILGYGVFDSPTSKNAVDVLKKAILEHGVKPPSILSDRGSSFYAVEAEAKTKGLTEFELYLMRNHIKQILSRVRHPQTNGKLEKLFDTIERGLAKGFSPIDRCVEWYNCIKPHGALDLERAETPLEAYYRKMEEKDELIDPSILTMESEMIL